MAHPINKYIPVDIQRGALRKKILITIPNAAIIQITEVKTIPLYKYFHTTQKWRATAYQAKTEELELTEYPAKLCFWHDSTTHKNNY